MSELIMTTIFNSEKRARLPTLRRVPKADLPGFRLTPRDEAIIQAIASGKRPAGMQPDEEAVYNFCTELLTSKQVSDQTFQATKDKFGERGIVDLIGVTGYYQLVSMLLNVDRYPLPEGVQAELKPLK